MSRPPERFTIDASKLAAELRAFRRLLGDPRRELSEREEILPFFKKHQNLAALLGTFNPLLGRPVRLKSELSLIGEVTCDVAVGDEEGHFCLVEFEEAAKNSVFKQTKGKVNPDWASRLEHGLSQIKDWFRVLEDQRNTGHFEHLVGGRLAHFVGVLVIGRDQFLTGNQLPRLRHRCQTEQSGGKSIFIMTFDQLFRTLLQRLETIQTPATTKSRRR